MTCKTKHLIGANRYNDWFERLINLVQSQKESHFEWGSFDCSQFCIQAEEAMYGETRWPDMIGGYKTKRGAMSRIKKKGADSLWQLIDQRMERRESVKMAQRGDWVGHYTEDGESLGIVIDNRFACVDVESGLNLLPLSMAVCAWRG